jgi:NADH:ubiquinone oxidoreductase subunit F (NADH-binding)
MVDTGTALRVLDAEPVADLDAYVADGGGRGLDAARKLGAQGVLDEVEAAGLRGRGGAGFPTARKWAAVLEHASTASPPDVVVNAAEGEPGSFKDRAILRANPYRVLEGALVAAIAGGADHVVVATKASFTAELARLDEAVAQIESAGWAEGISVEVARGPGEYLFGEETGLLEVLDGRPPFPRLAPPFRQGVDDDDQPATPAPPALVNNVETMANLPGIVADGPAWFRELGSVDSPGTIVCTVSGRTRQAGVGEFPMGTPLRHVIDRLGGGLSDGAEIVAVLSGVAHPLLPAAALDTPLTYEAMAEAGGGLGATGFIVFDDATDLAAVALGVSRFLAVESCGQCTPCKQDGLAIAEILERICGSEGSELDLVAIADHTATIADGARCYLAQQHQRVIDSVLAGFPADLRRHVTGELDAVEPELIAPIVDLVDGTAVLDEAQRAKQPDWSSDPTWSGESPVDVRR